MNLRGLNYSPNWQYPKIFDRLGNPVALCPAWQDSDYLIELEQEVERLTERERELEFDLDAALTRLDEYETGQAPDKAQVGQEKSELKKLSEECSTKEAFAKRLDEIQAQAKGSQPAQPEGTIQKEAQWTRVQRRHGKKLEDFKA